MPYIVIFYETAIGNSPVKEFLDTLDDKSCAKVMATINRLQQEGPELIRPFSDHVRGKVRELRIQFTSNQYRILYFFFLGNQIILVHGLKKKSQKLNESDIRLAENRMNDWIGRKSLGKAVK